MDIATIKSIQYRKNKILNERDQSVVIMFYDLYEKGYRPSVIYNMIEENEEIQKYSLTEGQALLIMMHHRKLVKKLSVNSKRVA